MLTALVLAYAAGVLSVYLWQMAGWLAERGIGPDGPTVERRQALADGWDGVGPLSRWRNRKRNSQ